MAVVETNLASTNDTTEHPVEDGLPAAIGAPPSQKVTKQMVSVSLYVAPAGSVFIFDLGQ